MVKRVDKKVLEEYIDACALVEETEKELRKLRRQRVKEETVQDSVTGSMSEFPYSPTRIHLEGKNFEILHRMKKRRAEELLEQRKARAENIKIQVEEWMNTIPLRMQRIIQYKIFERLSWQKVAIRMGNDVTADSVRMEYYKFMKKEK